MGRCQFPRQYRAITESIFALTALARKRLFDVEDGRKKTVYLLSSQVLDITTSELIPSSTFMYSVPRDTGNEVQDALLSLMQSKGGILLWKPAQIKELTGISIDRLNDARKRSWFVKNPYWQLITCTYEKTGRRSRKSNVTAKLLVMNGYDIDEQFIMDLNAYEGVQDIKFSGQW